MINNVVVTSRDVLWVAKYSFLVASGLMAARAVSPVVAAVGCKAGSQICQLFNKTDWAQSLNKTASDSIRIARRDAPKELKMAAIIGAVGLGAALAEHALGYTLPVSAPINMNMDTSSFNVTQETCPLVNPHPVSAKTLQPIQPVAPSVEPEAVNTVVYGPENAQPLVSDLPVIKTNTFNVYQVGTQGPQPKKLEGFPLFHVPSYGGRNYKKLG